MQIHFENGFSAKIITPPVKIQQRWINSWQVRGDSRGWNIYSLTTCMSLTFRQTFITYTEEGNVISPNVTIIQQLRHNLLSWLSARKIYCIYMYIYIRMYHILSSCKWSIYHTARNMDISPTLLSIMVYILYHILRES